MRSIGDMFLIAWVITKDDVENGSPVVFGSGLVKRIDLCKIDEAAAKGPCPRGCGNLPASSSTKRLLSSTFDSFEIWQDKDRHRNTHENVFCSYKFLLFLHEPCNLCSDFRKVDSICHWVVYALIRFVNRNCCKSRSSRIRMWHDSDVWRDEQRFDCLGVTGAFSTYIPVTPAFSCGNKRWCIKAATIVGCFFQRGIGPGNCPNFTLS